MMKMMLSQLSRRPPPELGHGAGEEEEEELSHPENAGPREIEGGGGSEKFEIQFLAPSAAPATLLSHAGGGHSSVSRLSS